jgi:hypothetical protein
MRVKILKTCGILLNGETRQAKAGETINLPDDKGRRLIDAGYADQDEPGTEEYRALFRELGERDPGGGCWEWISRHRPEPWKEHLRAFRAGDLDGARKLVIEMIEEYGAQGKGW